MNPTSLLYWYPIVRDECAGIPQPRTAIVAVEPPQHGETLIAACTLDHEHGMNGAAEECRSRFHELLPALREAADAYGYPVFVRTDLVSGKHGWTETCYVASAERMPINAENVIYSHADAMMWDEQGEVSALVVREFLALEAQFTAFVGMPIARERRYFISTGRVVCHHSYWIEDAVEKGVQYQGAPTAPPYDWRERLAYLNDESGGEILTLVGMAEEVAHAMQQHGGHEWSVDFAHTASGVWYLIDMAVAERSWHPECPVWERR